MTAGAADAHSFASSLKTFGFDQTTGTLRQRTSSSKLMVRGVMICCTGLHIAEVLLWLYCILATDAPSDVDWHSHKLPRSVPQIFSNLSAVALFTHFTIHVERQYRDDELLPPSPAISYHPFDKNSENTWATVLLKSHFVAHFSMYDADRIG